MAPAASRPATTGCTAPVASRITMAARTAMARLAPAPSGTPCCRTSAGESTTSTSGSASRLPSSAPHVPRSSSASPIARLVASSSVLAAALDGEHHEVAAVGDHARVHVRADEIRAGRDDDLRDPGVARDQRLRVGVEPVLARERARVAAEVGRDRLAVAVRQQPLAEEDDDRDRARHERDADERELEEPERLDAGVLRRGVDDHVDRRAGQRRASTRVRAECEREQQLRGRPAEPDRQQHDHRQERRDRAVDADQRGERGDQQHRQDDQPRPAVARGVDQALAGPGGDAGRVEGGAHDEQRGDEDDRLVAEARRSTARDRGRRSRRARARRRRPRARPGSSPRRRAPPRRRGRRT